MIKEVPQELLEKIAAVKKGMEYGKAERKTAAQLSFPGVINQQTSSRIQDATVKIAVNKLVSNLVSFLTPQQDKWADFSMHNDDDSLINRAILDESRDNLWDYYIDSPIYTVLEESFKDLVILGSGAIYIDYHQHTDKLVLQHVPTYELNWMYNKHNHADTVVCDFEKKFSVAKMEYPAIVHCDGVENMKDDSMITLTRIIYPVVEDSHSDGYKIRVIYGKQVIYEYDNLAYNPYIIFQWARNGTDMYGTSPVRNVITDIQHLYRINRIVLMSSEWRGVPPLTTPDAIDGDSLKLQSGVVSEAKSPPVPVQFTGQMQTTYQDLFELRQQIRESLFYFDAPAPADPDGQRTATEIRAMQQAFFRNISASAVRLERMLIRPLVEASIRLLILNGRENNLTIGQNNVIKFQDQDIIVKVTSGVKQEIDRQEGADLMGAFAQIAPMLETQPQLPVLFKMEDMLTDIATKLGIDEKYIRDEEEREQVIDQVAQVAEDTGELPPGVGDIANTLTGGV